MYVAFDLTPIKMPKVKSVRRSVDLIRKRPLTTRAVRVICLSLVGMTALALFTVSPLQSAATYVVSFTNIIVNKQAFSGI